MPDTTEISEKSNTNECCKTDIQAAGRMREEVPGCCGPASGCCGKNTQERDTNDRTSASTVGQPIVDDKTVAAAGLPPADLIISADLVTKEKEEIVRGSPFAAPTFDRVDLATLTDLIKTGQIMPQQAIALSGRPELASYLVSIHVNEPGELRS